jgi:hypothetical protein
MQYVLRRSSYLALAVLVLVAAFAGGHADSARAQTVADPDYWKGTAERQSTVNRLIYSQSPQSIPADYDPVREAEEILRQRQASLPSSNPQSRSIWRQLRNVVGDTRLSPSVRALGTIGLAVGTFEIGWKIGTGINAKFLRIGLPESGAQGASYCSPPNWPCTQELHYIHGTGSSLKPFPDWAGPNYPDTEGGVFAWQWMGCWATCSISSTRQIPDGAGAACDGDPSIPAALHVITAFSAGTRCSASSVPAQAGYLLPSDIETPGPIETYTDQPYSRSTDAPPPPPQTTVEQAVETELDKPENRVLRDWLNYQLGSPGQADPTGIGATLPDIPFPNFDEVWEDHGHEFEEEYDDAVEYWEDAADIVKRGRAGQLDIQPCHRDEDDADLYWDDEKGAIVVVKNGKIITYFPPEDGFAYFEAECRK